MTTIDLKIDLAPEAAPLIEALRGVTPRDVFLRKALEIGLCQIIREAASVTQDKLEYQLRANSAEWREFKALISVEDPATIAPTPRLPSKV